MNQNPPAPRFANVMALTLPASMAAVLAWGYLNPDDAVTAASPHQVRPFRSSRAAPLVPAAQPAERRHRGTMVAWPQPGRAMV